MSITSDRSDVTTTKPEAPVRAPAGRHRSRRALLGWAAVAAACLAATALAVATLAGDDDSPGPAVTTPVPAHAGIIEHGSPRAIEGSVETPPTTRSLPPSAEATGSNVEDMPPVTDRGTFPPSGPAADGDPDEGPPVVSRSQPPV